MAQRVARIGVLVPAGNVVHEREFRRLQPGGVTFRFAGFGYPVAGAHFCADLVERLGPQLDDLTAWGADLVLLGCTTAAMICDCPDFSAALQARAGVPIVTSATASREALQALGIRQAAVATPYGEANNAIVRDFLTESGVAIERMEGLALDASVETWVAGQATLTPHRVLDLCRTANSPSAEGLYLPCTGMVSLDAIAAFESETGKPAVSSVQAGYWASLRRLAIDGRHQGLGRLLATWDLNGQARPTIAPPNGPTE